MRSLNPIPFCCRFNQTTFSLSPCQSPPNFLHAASLAKHVKPVVVIPDEEEPEQQDDDDDDPEPLIEVSDVSTSSVQAQPQVWPRGHGGSGVNGVLYRRTHASTPAEEP